jgi:hypothetical protein
MENAMTTVHDNQWTIQVLNDLSFDALQGIYGNGLTTEVRNVIQILKAVVREDLDDLRKLRFSITSLQETWLSSMSEYQFQHAESVQSLINFQVDRMMYVVGFYIT